VTNIKTYQNVSERTKFLLAALFIVSAILLLYHRALHYEFVGFDDNDLVILNPNIKGLGLDRIWRLISQPYLTLFIPVTMLSYLMDYQLWFLTPFGFRFTNILIHFFNCLLALKWIKALHKNFALAFASALIFAVHPVQIESVVWVAERKNLLSTFFLFLALIAHWKSVKGSATFMKERKWLFLSLTAYVLALLSKPSVVIFLPIVFAINYFFLNNSHEFKRRWWFYGAVFGLSALAGIMTVQGTAAEVEKYTYHGNSFWITLFVMSTVFWRYVELLLFPFHQNILYSSFAFRSFFQLPVFLSIIGLVLFFAVIWVFRKRKPGVSFWLSWFFIGLLPVSNILAPLPSIMNDRYLYVPMLGFFVAIFVLLNDVFPQFLFNFKNRRAQLSTIACVSVLVVPFVILTSQRLPDWKNATSLWAAAFQRSPRKDPRIFYFSAINEIDQGRYQHAIDLLKESLAADPTINARLALGTACVAAGKFDEAEPVLKQVIELDPKRAGAYDQLGVVYRKTHRYEEAEELFKKALAIAPRMAVIHNNYALLLMDEEKPEAARGEWEYALQLDPDCHFALRNLAWFHFTRGKLDAAAFYLIRYLKRDPNDLQMRDLAKTIQEKLDQKAQKPG